jgi:hypothetical protein
MPTQNTENKPLALIQFFITKKCSYTKSMITMLYKIKLCVEWCKDHFESLLIHRASIDKRLLFFFINKIITQILYI